MIKLTPKFESVKQDVAQIDATNVNEAISMAIEKYHDIDQYADAIFWKRIIDVLEEKHQDEIDQITSTVHHTVSQTIDNLATVREYVEQIKGEGIIDTDNNK